jgi:hypothetical protein
MTKLPYIHTDHGTHGLILVNADPDGQNGYVRGIATYNDGLFMALTGAASRSFKTLAGATRYMEKRGYDSFGRTPAQVEAEAAAQVAADSGPCEWCGQLGGHTKACDDEWAKPSPFNNSQEG